MTVRNPAYENAIVELYRSGLSRHEIRSALSNRVSERYIREVTGPGRRTFEWKHEHDISKLRVRQEIKGIAHNQRQFADIYKNRMVGRGMRKARSLGVGDQAFADRYWRKRHEGGNTVEGSGARSEAIERFASKYFEDHPEEIGELFG